VDVQRRRALVHQDHLVQLANPDNPVKMEETVNQDNPAQVECLNRWREARMDVSNAQQDHPAHPVQRDKQDPLVDQVNPANQDNKDKEDNPAQQDPLEMQEHPEDQDNPVDQDNQEHPAQPAMDNQEPKDHPVNQDNPDNPVNPVDKSVQANPAHQAHQEHPVDPVNLVHPADPVNQEDQEFPAQMPHIVHVHHELVKLLPLADPNHREDIVNENIKSYVHAFVIFYHTIQYTLIEVVK